MSLANGDKIIGVIHPLSRELIDRFLKGGKDIFIKPVTIYKNIRPGQLFFFYQTGSEGGIALQAKIKDVSMVEEPSIIYGKYNGRVFLSESEFREYLSNQDKRWFASKPRKKMKKWIVYELVSIKGFDSLKKPKRVVVQSGRYVTQEDYSVFR